MKTPSSRLLKLLSLLLTGFDLLMYFAMRPCWSGISKTFGYSNGKADILLAIPVMICILLLLIFLANLAALLFKPEGRRWPLAFTIIGAVFLAAIVVIIKLGAAAYIRFVLQNFLVSLAAAAAVLLAAFLLFIYPKTALKDKQGFKACALALLLLAAGLSLTRFAFGGISCGPVVYAVEDEYQIVFSGRSASLASVIIDGKEFDDLYAGSLSGGRIHKVSVPMTVLDAAKAYEIRLQKIIYRGPFAGILGKTFSEKHSFTPADTSDGLQYLSFSDIHMHKNAALRTEAAAPDYDFLVIGGDTISVVDTFADANYVNKLLSAMTGGEKPVIYARGNHEVKGRYAEQLDRFVGSKNGSFCYTVSLGDVCALVLDLGEDHDDDWWEYYGTARYDAYRDEQSEFLKNELASGSLSAYTYRLAICHIPPVYVNYRHNHEAVKAEWTDLLNQMDIDMCVCGHQHEALIFEPQLVTPHEKLVYNPAYDSGTYNGYLTDFDFPCLMVSKPGYTQTDENTKSQIGLYISADLTSGSQTCFYLNSDGKKVSVVNPFALKDYGEEIVIAPDGSWQ